MKIGVFDSGVGGVTVLAELRREFGAEHFVYLGDTAHVPYGAKSPSQVRKLSADCAQTLRQLGVEVVVVACNTASSLALPEIQAACGPEVRVVGVVIPGVRAALEAHQQLADPAAPVLVLATRATVRSGAYRKKLEALQLNVIEQACPLLVPMIEEGWTDHPVLHQTIEEYVKPHRMAYSSGVALLGCTHYPWIQLAFEKALPGWQVVNSAAAVAAHLRQHEAIPQSTGPGVVDWLFTDPEAIPAFVSNQIGIHQRGKS
ncbi:MAG: glutamate racemase [Oligoflexia bacterium]